MSSFLKKINDYFLTEIWNLDFNSLNKFKRFLIKALRLLYVSIRELRAGDLNLRAMSLVYTTVLSLVPLIAVGFSILKGFGVHNQAEPLLLNFFAPLGPKSVDITAKIIEFVDNVRAGILGTIGLALLIYTVISLLQKIEDAFNHIWKIQQSRTFLQRFSDYISIVLVGPILVVTALAITASVLSTTIVQKLKSIEPFGTVFFLSGKIIPFILVCLAFTLVYIFIPNIKVRFKSALVGGIFAGVFWQASGWAFASFIANSTKYTAIYSGFAILILFMIWLYYSWLILLLGGSLSFYYQYPQFLNVKKEQFHLSNRLKERLAFTVMVLIGFRFLNRVSNWTFDSLIQRLGVPMEPLQDVLLLLEKKKFIIKTCDSPPQYMPAADLGMIKLKEFWWTIRGAEEDTFALEDRYLSTPGIDALVKELVDESEKVFGDRTLMDMVLLHTEESPDSIKKQD